MARKNRTRSMREQLHYAVKNSIAIGKSKRTDRQNGKAAGRLYSIENIEKIRDTCNNLAAWLHDQHPEIRRVVDLSSEIIQEYLDNGSKRWSAATCAEMTSRLRTIEQVIRNTYGRCNMTDGLRIPEPDHDRIRTKAMDPADLDALRKSFADRNSQSDGRIALEIAYRGGLRAREVARLHTDQIDIENAILRKIDGKGGKLRDVPIRRQDMEFFTTLKQQGGYVCRNSGHRNADGTGINRAIRDEMRRIGIAEKYEKTTIHAIRKLYARERMMELTGTDLRQDPRQNFKERKAWEIVQTELGHGSTLRMELYVRYVL